MSDALNNLSDSLAAAVEQVAAGVVRVEARRRLPASGFWFGGSDLVVTASHVVERDENITVGLANGETRSATLVGRDPTTDVAVLRVVDAPGGSLPALATQPLKVGHLVLALGRPGRAVQATLGLVNGLDEAWRTPWGGTIDQFIQTDLEMLPGFSGGPLITTRGEIAGLNTSAILRDSAAVLPVSTLQRIVQSLVEHGRVRRSYLGIGTQPVRLPAALQTERQQKAGLLVISVEPDSPAEKGGVLLGDVLVGFEGQPIRSSDDFLAQLSGDRINQPVRLTILRGGQMIEVTPTLGERS